MRARVAQPAGVVVAAVATYPSDLDTVVFYCLAYTICCVQIRVQKLFYFLQILLGMAAVQSRIRLAIATCPRSMTMTCCSVTVLVDNSGLAVVQNQWCHFGIGAPPL